LFSINKTIKLNFNQNCGVVQSSRFLLDVVLPSTIAITIWQFWQVKCIVEKLDAEATDLLTKILEVLNSNTGYFVSLAARIRSFHSEVKTKKE